MDHSRTFQQSRLTANDRVFFAGARSRVTTSVLTASGATFAGLYLYKMIRGAPGKRRWPLPLFASLLIAFPVTINSVRSEYRRAVVELDDQSYLRKFLFNTAILANPDLNAQQVYSKLALEEYDDQQRRKLADSGALPYQTPTPPPIQSPPSRNDQGRRF